MMEAWKSGMRNGGPPDRTSAFDLPRVPVVRGSFHVDSPGQNEVSDG